MYQRLLVPVDGSPTSDRGLNEAINLGKATGARLRLIHAVDEFVYGTGLEAYADVGGQVFTQLRKHGDEILKRGREAVETAGLEVETQLFERLTGTLTDLVVREAREWRADMIVLGTHGRRGLRRMMIGSDAEQILRATPVPLLLVRGDDGVAAPIAAIDASAKLSTFVLAG